MVGEAVEKYVLCRFLVSQEPNSVKIAAKLAKSAWVSEVIASFLPPGAIEPTMPPPTATPNVGAGVGHMPVSADAIIPQALPTDAQVDGAPDAFNGFYVMGHCCTDG